MDSRLGSSIGSDSGMGQGRQPAPISGKSGIRETQAQSTASPDEVLNISVVSNSRLLRDGLLLLLGEQVSLQRAGSYPGAPLPAACAHNPPGHVVLLDASMGDDAAVAWTRYWLALDPRPHVVVLELANNTGTILACIEAGASGYAVQGASLEEVLETIRGVQRHEAHCSPEVTAALFTRVAAYNAAARQPKEPVMPPRAPLTPRELEVLTLIAENYSNQEIAARLVIQVHTVKHHVHNILEKLELQHRWDAAHLAIQSGWLETEPSALQRRG